MSKTDLEFLLDLWKTGRLSGDAAMNIIAIDLGRAKRTAESQRVGDLVTQAASGKAGAIEALLKEVG